MKNVAASSEDPRTVTPGDILADGTANPVLLDDLSNRSRYEGMKLWKTYSLRAVWAAEALDSSVNQRSGPVAWTHRAQG